MEESINDRNLKRRSLVSTLSLFFQSGYSAVLGLAANLILTVLLSPAVFGIYITTLAIISLMNYFSDIGLAGALIQKKDLNEDDLATTFTVQQLLALILVFIGFLISNFVKNFYKLPIDGVYLYWALLAAFFISSFKTIPSIFLERKIQFQKIVFVQVVENTVFYAIVSVLAILGFGLKSFTIAVLFRSIVGLILIYSISFWLPKIKISRSSLKQLLSFGIPFQATSFLALFKDDLIILYLGKVLGFEGLGYIGWAKKWAEAPLRIIMDNVSKVVFPLVSQFQDNLERVKKLAEKILHYQTALIAPALLGLILVMDKFVDAIPNYQKWQPALPLFYIFALSSLMVSFSAPFMNIFFSLGKVKLAFRYMVIFTVLTWVLTPLLITKFGLYGFPVAHILVSISFILVLLKAKEIINFKFFSSTYQYLLSSFFMAIVIFILNLTLSFQPRTMLTLDVLTGIVSYYGFLKMLFKIDLLENIKSLYAQK